MSDSGDVIIFTTLLQSCSLDFLTYIYILTLNKLYKFLSSKSKFLNGKKLPEVGAVCVLHANLRRKELLEGQHCSRCAKTFQVGRLQGQTICNF